MRPLAIRLPFLLCLSALLPLSAFSEKKVTSKPCPYDCRTLGLNGANCKDYKIGNTCYVEKENGEKAPTGSRICINSATGQLRIREKCNSGESEASLASLKGDKGDTGETGPQGIQGPAGIAGSNGSTGPQGAQGLQGPAGSSGAAGTAGADGTLRVYGDGSAGDVTISSNQTFNFLNSQFDDFAVQSGVTLTVPTGTIIRCTGTFTNEGTINVLPALESNPKISENGIVSTAFESASEALGGFGGIALPLAGLRNILRPGLLGGGIGAKLNTELGGQGGGNFTVVCAGALSNAATGIINADGTDAVELGRGGGGGGIIVLLSRTSVTNAGAILARGGDGAGAKPGSSTDGLAPGGGGGGGLVNIVSPSNSNTGTITLSGGSGGAAGGAGTIASTFYSGGGGGGASGGDGGNGGAVNPANIGNNSVSAGVNGSTGVQNAISADPTSLF